MDTFILLLRSRRKKKKLSLESPLQPGDIRDQAASFGFQLFDVAVTAGIFDAVVLCRVEDRHVLTQFLAEMEAEWESDFLVAEQHRRIIEGLPIASSIIKTSSDAEN
ncbi:MAG: hypothetical protein WBS18_11050 [Candidatus Acidiferrales bacterium]